MRASVPRLPTTEGALHDVMPTFAVDTSWPPPARASVYQAATTLASPATSVAFSAPPTRLLSQPSVVRTMAVALHVTYTLQDIKRNAKTEGEGALEVSVAKQELRVVRNRPQEGTSLLLARSDSLGVVLARGLARLKAHGVMPPHVVVSECVAVVTVGRPSYLRRITVSSRVRTEAEHRIALPQVERSRHLVLDALGSPRQSLRPRHLGSERRLHRLVTSELQGRVPPRSSEEVERSSRLHISICVCCRESLRGQRVLSGREKVTVLIKEGEAATPGSDVSKRSRGRAGGDATAPELHRKLQLQPSETLVLGGEVVQNVGVSRGAEQRVARRDELGDGV